MNKSFERPTMMTLSETAEYFGLAKHFIRSLVLSGKIVHVRAGKKYLVHAEKFAEYLDNGGKNEKN